MIQNAISVVIPMHNEEKNVRPLLDELFHFLINNFSDFEIIIINDASSDGTLSELKLYNSTQAITIINNDKNCGQGYSVITGCLAAKFSLIVTMDGDMQVNPTDILKLYKHREMYKLDFVASRRKINQNDGAFSHIPSLLGNILIRAIYKVDLIDVGSSLKLFPTKEVVNIPKFKNVHRYISIFLHYKGLKYEEVEVTSRVRFTGKSKYSGLKFIRAFVEIIFLRIQLSKIVSPKLNSAQVD